MKDSLNSWDQRSWEFAANGHARAVAAIQGFDDRMAQFPHLRDCPNIQKIRQYWVDTKEWHEKKYPALKKGF